MRAVPVVLSYSTLSTSPPPLLGFEKLISSRSFILSVSNVENTLESFSFLLEMSKWTYSGDSRWVKNEIQSYAFSLLFKCSSLNETKSDIKVCGVCVYLKLNSRM